MSVAPVLDLEQDDGGHDHWPAESVPQGCAAPAAAQDAVHGKRTLPRHVL